MGGPVDVWKPGELETITPATNRFPTPEQIAYYYDNPCAFAEDLILKYRKDKYHVHLAIEQMEMLNAVASNPRTSIRSGHGTGKTAGLSFLTMWFLTTRPNSLVVVTAPKADQIRDTMWTEINRWLIYSPVKSWFQWTAEKIASRYFPQDWYAVARTAKEPQNLAGFHADHLMFIVDEAAGVADEIFEVIEGALTSDDNRLVMTSQGIKANGYFFDSHNSDAKDWKTLHFDSEKSRLANPAYAARIARKYGQDSDVYRVRVNGEFPKGNADAFIQLSEVLLAVSRDIPIVQKAPFELGVDVSRGGDDLTVIAPRQGNRAFPERIYPGSIKDLVVVASLVIEAVKDYRQITGYKGPVRVKIDDTGVGGGVTDILKHDTENLLIIVPINFAAGVTDEKADEFYDNLISQLWGEFKQQLPHIQLPEDELLQEELATRRTVPGRGGRIRIEPKERFKRDYKASPDRADAIIMAFARGAEKKRIIPGFSHNNPKVCRDYKINWKLLDRNRAKVYASIYQEADLTTSIVCTLWDGIEGKLWVFEELVAASPRPEIIVPRLQDKLDKLTSPKTRDGFTMDPSTFLWVANNTMFGLSEKARSTESMKDGTANLFMSSEFSLPLMPNIFNDEAGSIASTGRLFAGQHICIHTRCESIIQDIEEWTVENEKVEKGSGLALALCGLANMLFKTHKVDHQKYKLKPYSQAKMHIKEELEKADRDNSLEEYDERMRKGGF